jgi:hypothetical protein
MYFNGYTSHFLHQFIEENFFDRVAMDLLYQPFENIRSKMKGQSIQQMVKSCYSKK